MKILIANDGPTAMYYIRLGLARAFQSCGHTVEMWDVGNIPVFDVFDTFEPDLFIGQTYNTTRALCQAISERPHLKVIMKASDWGQLPDRIDSNTYPILKANPAELKTILDLHDETGKPDFVHIHYHQDYIEETHGHWINRGVPATSILSAADIFDYHNGQKRPELQSQICFIGGYWGYKAQVLDRWLLPLCGQSYRIKIFGNSPWPVPEYCGFLPNEVIKDALASAQICPNLSEPHSQVYGFDVIERPFKLLSSKCLVISDYVEGLARLFPNGEIQFASSPDIFKDLIDFFLKQPEQADQYINAGYQSVMNSHTYFHRAAQIFEELKLSQHAQHCMNVYQQIRNTI